MAALEDILDQMLGQTGTAGQSPMAGLIGALFHGVPGGMNAGGVGGLAGLASHFDQAGLGGIIQSWIGNGANLPITPDQLERVLGTERVGAIASHNGVPASSLLTELAQLLPGMVDRMTPDGHLPDDR